jgi:hypothetical protein
MTLRSSPNPPLAGSSFTERNSPSAVRLEGARRGEPLLQSATIWARNGLILPLTILASLSISVLNAAETDQEVEARKAALDLAGAFSNDGFKMRDGHWCGTIKPHEHALIAVNLYAGNQYWFTVGAPAPAKKLALNVYDETGKQVSTEAYNAGEKAAAGFSPTSSGQYYVSVGLTEGAESSVCFVYSYK